MLPKLVAAICFIWIIGIYASEDVALVQKKIYDVPNAMVYYKISGGGVISPDVNLTIEGTGKLRFKEWGAEELFETQIVERATGSIHYIDKKKKCKKRQEKEILDVDFKGKKILERPIPKGKTVRNITKGLTKNGQQMIANIVCDMWEGNGVRKCIYKGIPLFTEYNVLGLFYREEAIEVEFDINVTETSKCTIPKYPVEKFSLYTTSFKTKSKKAPKAFSERLLKVIEMLNAKKIEDEKLLPKEKKRLMNMIGEPIFENQKRLLPELLETMKKTRACLVQAKGTVAANSCLSDLAKIKPYFAGDEYYRIEEWEKNKEKTLDMFDDNIFMLQSKMKCIRGAKTLSDLSACMKK